MTLIARLLSTALAMAVAACSPPAADDTRGTLSVAATAVPHAEILEAVKPTLARDGVDLRIEVFSDYVQPNDQVAQDRIDINYFQTEPYLRAYNQDRGTDLTPLAGIHIEPFGAYSRRFQSLDALPEGASVAIPNDPSNNSRALLLLHKHGVITLRDPQDAMASQRDIVANPKRLKLRELDAAMLSRVLDQVDLALINTNYALDAGLNPVTDALAIEDKRSPYVNFVVGKADKANDPRVRKLIAALKSEQTRTFIQNTYKGAVLPAF